MAAVTIVCIGADLAESWRWRIIQLWSEGAIMLLNLLKFVCCLSNEMDAHILRCPSLAANKDKVPKECDRQFRKLHRNHVTLSYNDHHDLVRCPAARGGYHVLMLANLETSPCRIHEALQGHSKVEELALSHVRRRTLRSPQISLATSALPLANTADRSYKTLKMCAHSARHVLCRCGIVKAMKFARQLLP